MPAVAKGSFEVAMHARTARIATRRQEEEEEEEEKRTRTGRFIATSRYAKVEKNYGPLLNRKPISRQEAVAPVQCGIGC
jgi:hypothetical protein